MSNTLKSITRVAPNTYEVSLDEESAGDEVRFVVTVDSGHVDVFWSVDMEKRWPLEFDAKRAVYRAVAAFHSAQDVPLTS